MEIKVIIYAISVVAMFLLLFFIAKETQKKPLKIGYIIRLLIKALFWPINVFVSIIQVIAKRIVKLIKKEKTYPSPSLRRYAAERGIKKDGMTAEMILTEIYEKEKKQ